MDRREFEQWLKDPHRRPVVMGVLNVTPDSFSDGGRFAVAESAVAAARRMCAEGAEIIDIGGESTRPGAGRVPAREQIARIEPVVQAVAGEGLPCLISVDTTLSEVAERALGLGAAIVNDISAGREDPRMLELAADRAAGIVLMHMQGEPQTMQASPQYSDVVTEVEAFLIERREAAVAAGVERERIILDPGIGFGKTLEHNLALLRATRRLADCDSPLLMGTSRKSFIGRVTGETDPRRRIFGTAATVAWSVANGASVVRVHDVDATVKVVRMIRAIQSGGVPEAPGR